MADKTLTARLEALKEMQTQLEAEARSRRTELIEELRTVCALAGKVPRELLDGIIDGRRRGPKPGAKKAARKAATKAQKQATATENPGAGSTTTEVPA